MWWLLWVSISIVCIVAIGDHMRDDGKPIIAFFVDLIWGFFFVGAPIVGAIYALKEIFTA